MTLGRIVALISLLLAPALFASDQTEALQKSIDELKKKMSAEITGEKTADVVDQAVFRTVGFGVEENNGVKSCMGRVTISGLVQVWYESVQNDRFGVFRGAPVFTAAGGIPSFRAEDNVGNSIDTFRVRRTELRFKIEITDKVGAFIMMDPARESNTLFAPIPTLLRHNEKTTISADFQNGTVSTFHPSLLQDGYIVVHDFDTGMFDDKKNGPHHTFAIGQYKPPAGEEASRDSGSLDFVERAMVAGVNNVRDLGAAIYGTWFDERFKYQLGFFNGPSGTVLTDPEVVEAGNRPDDNNAKDFAWRLQGRPWNVVDPKTKAWYGLETGIFRTDGVHGGAGQEFDPNFGVLNTLDREKTHITRQGAWLYLKPNGPVRGLWVRGEYGRLHDIFGGDAKTTALGIGSVDLLNTNFRGSSFFSQADPQPVSVHGWYASTGYKMSDSPFSEALLKKKCRLADALNGMEFCFRAEAYQNIATENLVRPDRKTDLFYTTVYTIGANYSMNSNTRLQANYLFVVDPSSPSHGIAEVKNNVFVVNFQLKF
ncbi:MAG TPA: hypothetical protein VKX17_20995 [Planctomycetota bacterium]|nr:hypothetical protein [Planctomycetota bacterium]